MCFLSFILLTRYIELVSLGRTLHSRDKSHVVLVCNPFHVLLDSVGQDFAEDICTDIHDSQSFLPNISTDLSNTVRNILCILVHSKEITQHQRVPFPFLEDSTCCLSIISILDWLPLGPC